MGERIIVDGPSGGGKGVAVSFLKNRGFQRARGLATLDPDQQSDQTPEAQQILREGGLVGKNPIELLLHADVRTLSAALEVLDRARIVQEEHIATLEGDVVIDGSYISEQTTLMLINKIRSEPTIQQIIRLLIASMKEHRLPATGIVYVYATPEVLAQRRQSDPTISEAELAMFPQVLGVELAEEKPSQRLTMPDGFPLLAIDTGRVSFPEETRLINLFVNSLR